MRIIPVLDVKGGKAVLARGGDRAHYAPVRSILHEGADPVGLAMAYRDRLGLDTVYLADLDAISGGLPNAILYRNIIDMQIRLWVDAGIRSVEDVESLPDSGVDVLIAGLETLRGPEALAALVDRLGPDRVAFSLDLRERSPVGSDGFHGAQIDPRRITSIAAGFGIARLIVLDLAQVGTGRGVGTIALIAALRCDHPGMEIVGGGGVSGPGDLRKLRDAGASAALVGSALHDGRISERPG